MLDKYLTDFNVTGRNIDCVKTKLTALQIFRVVYYDLVCVGGLVVYFLYVNLLFHIFEFLFQIDVFGGDATFGGANIGDVTPKEFLDLFS